MTEMEVVAGRSVRIETTELEAVRVRVLPGGRMDSNNAAKYLNRAPTLGDLLPPLQGEESLNHCSLSSTLKRPPDGASCAPGPS